MYSAPRRKLSAPARPGPATAAGAREAARTHPARGHAIASAQHEQADPVLRAGNPAPARSHARQGGRGKAAASRVRSRAAFHDGHRHHFQVSPKAAGSGGSEISLSFT